MSGHDAPITAYKRERPAMYQEKEKGMTGSSMDARNVEMLCARSLSYGFPALGFQRAVF
jgi:hypothetical protein